MYKTDPVELGNRLTRVWQDQREKNNLKAKSSRSFALSIGADASYFARAERGKGLSDEYIDAIVKEYGVSEEWLRFGIGEMYGQGSPKNVSRGTQKEKRMVEPPAGDIDKMILYNLSVSSREQSEALHVIAEAHKILALRSAFPGASLAELDRSNEARIQTLTEYIIQLGAEVRKTDEKAQTAVLDTIETGVLALYSDKGSGDSSDTKGKSSESLESSVGS